MLSRPRFMQEKSLSPAERGTAMHAVMQHIDFSRPASLETISSKMDEMVRKELLTEEQRASIEPQLIVHFSKLSWGKEWFRLNRYAEKSHSVYLSLPGIFIQIGRVKMNLFSFRGLWTVYSKMSMVWCSWIIKRMESAAVIREGLLKPNPFLKTGTKYKLICTPEHWSRF